MKKLLLAFSIIAAFGLGVTATSIVIPPNKSVEIQEGDEKKEKKKKKKKKKGTECCTKTSADNKSNKTSCCSKEKTNPDKK